MELMSRLLISVIGWGVALCYVALFTRELFIIAIIPSGTLTIGHVGHPLILWLEVSLGMFAVVFVLHKMKEWMRGLGKG